MPTDESRRLHELEIEVEVELDMVYASHSEETIDVPPSDWLLDPTDAEREEVGLRNIIGAVEVLEGEEPE
jgi:hypothetical protein